ncbi:hypothetical protein ABIA95_000196 [Bradyrhizobium sp. LA8.1]
MSGSLLLAVTSTGWGQGPAAFDRIGEMLPSIACAMLLLVAIWIICKVRA